MNKDKLKNEDNCIIKLRLGFAIFFIVISVFLSVFFPVSVFTHDNIYRYVVSCSNLDDTLLYEKKYYTTATFISYAEGDIYKCATEFKNKNDILFVKRGANVDRLTCSDYIVLFDSEMDIQTIEFYIVKSVTLFNMTFNSRGAITLLEHGVKVLTIVIWLIALTVISKQVISIIKISKVLKTRKNQIK